MSAPDQTSAVLAPVLELGSISAGYGDSIVLRDIDLTVGSGQVVALLGSNGAGKTTLLRVASGLIKPRQGVVRLEGDEVTGVAAHRRAQKGLCLIPEGRGIFPNLSVGENLRLQLPKGGAGALEDEALDAYPVLKKRLAQKAGSLSGGEQQMLALCRCILSEPSVILLDEVSLGLAPLIVDEIFESLASLAARGISILLAEQYVNRALAIASSVCVIDRGRISLMGKTEEVDLGALLAGYLGTDELEGQPSTKLLDD